VWKQSARAGPRLYATSDEATLAAHVEGAEQGALRGGRRFPSSGAPGTFRRSVVVQIAF
jgi:hypothetical protein